MEKIYRYLRMHWFMWTSITTLTNFEIAAPIDILAYLVVMMERGELYAVEEFGMIQYSMSKPPSFVATLPPSYVKRHGLEKTRRDIGQA